MTDYFFDDWVIQIEEFDAAYRPGVALRGNTLADVDAGIRAYEAPYVQAREGQIAADKARQREEELVGRFGRRAPTHDEYLRLTGRKV